MIAHVRGQVAEKFANSVIIDVQGVGYEVTLSSIDFDNLTSGQLHQQWSHHGREEGRGTGHSHREGHVAVAEVRHDVA